VIAIAGSHGRGVSPLLCSRPRGHQPSSPSAVSLARKPSHLGAAHARLLCCLRLECEYAPLAHCLPCLVDGASPHRLGFFLPGVLDHFKFTDVSLVTRCWPWPDLLQLLIFVLVQLLGEGGWIFNRTRSFYGWNIAVLAYVALMSAAGWREGFDPTLPLFPARRATLFTFFA